MALAVVHDEGRRRKDTVAALKRAVQCKAKPNEKVDAGRMLARLGEPALGLAEVRQGYEESGASLRLASYTLRVALQCADWELSGRITAQLRQAHAQGRTAEASETPRTHVLWCADEATNMAVIAAFAKKAYPERERLVTTPWPHDGKRKLRVGYLSSDYRDHATSLLALGMLRHHDRSRFEWYGYCTSYDDGSALRREMISRFDKARTLGKLTDRQAAEIIVKDKIDVLVDLNGLTEGTRHGVMAWHPAPVQMSYLGYPGTVGGRFVEYVIGDDYTVPEGAEKLFPEKIIRIPPTYQINDYLARYLPPAPSRDELGLPSDRPVVGMFNNVNKVGPEVWKTWMRVLLQMPKAVFWMLDPGPVASEHLKTQAQALGVDLSRLIFAPKL
jgi:predicted O-linked N-acetylglucosamine transferase (SPINDLY family)